jgi:hypothetical protein
VRSTDAEPVGTIILDDAIIREVGTCLRLIEYEEDTPTWYPEELQERVYDFWETAQQDIWTDWMRETDPASQPQSAARMSPFGY